jgi:hypothetical protein
VAPTAEADLGPEAPIRGPMMTDNLPAQNHTVAGAKWSGLSIFTRPMHAAIAPHRGLRKQWCAMGARGVMTDSLDMKHCIPSAIGCSVRDFWLHLDRRPEKTDRYRAAISNN